MQEISTWSSIVLYKGPQHGNSEIEHTQRRPIAPDLASYVAQAHDRASRNAAIARAYASGDYSMQAIANAFGLHYSTVSRAVSDQ